MFRASHTPYSEKLVVSATKSVTFRGRGSWAYDVVLGVFLKYLIVVLEAMKQLTNLNGWTNSVCSNAEIASCHETVAHRGDAPRVPWDRHPS